MIDAMLMPEVYFNFTYRDVNIFIVYDKRYKQYAVRCRNFVPRTDFDLAVVERRVSLKAFDVLCQSMAHAVDIFLCCVEDSISVL